MDGRPRSAFASESRRGGEWCAVSGRAVSGSDCVRRSAAEDADDDGRSELRSDCVSRAENCCDVRETRESDDSASAASGNTSCALYTVSSFGAASSVSYTHLTLPTILLV